MPTMWFSLKRSLHCKSEASEVHDPKTKKQLSNILTRKSRRSGCSRSIANLKDVIHGSKRHWETPVNCSPRSIGSSEFLNPITHEVILSNSKTELHISGFGGGFQEDGGGVTGGGVNSTYVGTLRPGTPGPGGHPAMHYFNSSIKNPAATPPRKSALLTEREGTRFGGVSNLRSGNGVSSEARPTVETDDNGSSSSVTCHKCGEQFGKMEALEAHHLSKHAGKYSLFCISIHVLYS